MGSDNSTRVCFSLSPPINSRGIWGDSIQRFSLPLLQLQMFVVFAITEVIHFFLKPLGLPSISSQIITGLILSPLLLGSREEMKYLFPNESRGLIDLVGLLGFAFFLVLAGVKMDFTSLLNTGKKALFIGVVAFVVPLGASLKIQGQLCKYMLLSEEQNHSLEFLTTIIAATSFAVIASSLQEMRLINSEFGQLALSATLVNNLFSTALRIVIITQRSASDLPIKNGLFMLIIFIAVAGFVVFVIQPLLYWIINQTPEGRPVRRIHVKVILMMVFASSLFTSTFAHFPLLGLFLFGLLIPNGPPLGTAFVDKLDGLTTGVFLPFYVSTSVMDMDVNKNTSQPKMVNAGVILAFVATFLKVASTMGSALCSKMPLIDAVTLGLIMSIKGVVELSIISASKENMLIPIDVYTATVFYILFNINTVHLLVKWLYDPKRQYAGYQKRSIMHNRSADLTILTCIYHPSNIASVITLLKATNPTPVHVNVLHLIEQNAQYSPIFISHQLQTKSVRSCSYSQNVLVSFDAYQRLYPDVAKVNTFTAISPPNLMHEDICTLALKKQTSMIVLPFHRRWAMDGSNELEDKVKRALNLSVLERAPCSVGLLVDHSHKRRIGADSDYRVCMIFIGDKDDREALALANRMANDPMVQLTVIRLISCTENLEIDWNKMLDSEELKFSKSSTEGKSNVTYIEEMAKDGSQTSKIIHSLRNEHDLFIVGRHHSSDTQQLTGLSEWSEVPELGELGDLLASKELNIRALVLVVQQQIIT